MKTIVAGVGMIPFTKPGASDPYDRMGEAAIRLALEDAGVDYESVEQAFAGYVYGDSTAGQRVIYRVGMTGVPIVNVNNNCSTGSTALYLARQAIESGMSDCVLAVGFEQMKPGALSQVFDDRPSPFLDFDTATDELVDVQDMPMTLRYFGGAGQSHMQKYGTSMETFASIRAKASRHAARNPLSLFRKEMTVDEVMDLMTRGRFRHLPVCEDGVLVGVISIGDVVRRRIEDAEREAEDMRAYIHTAAG